MHGLQTCLFKYIIVAAYCIYLSVVKMPLKWEVGCHALKSHGNYIVDHRKAWKNHGIVFLDFCGIPDMSKCKGFWCLWHNREILGNFGKGPRAFQIGKIS